MLRRDNATRDSNAGQIGAFLVRKAGKIAFRGPGHTAQQPPNHAVMVRRLSNSPPLAPDQQVLLGWGATAR
jgi:hypothetical protein